MPYAFTFNIQCNWNWNFCLKNPHFSMLKIYRIILNSHLFLVLRYWSFKYIDMNILYTGTWQIYAHFWLKHTGCWISTGLHSAHTGTQLRTIWGCPQMHVLQTIQYQWVELVLENQSKNKTFEPYARCRISC